MSWQYYLNMESLAYGIADKHIRKMKESILDKTMPEYLDEKKTVHNLEHGFIAVTMLVTFFESFINSLVRLECGDYAENFLKKSIAEKIELLYLTKGVEKALFSKLLGDADYQKYKEVSNVRNELIHFKLSTTTHSTFLCDFKIGKQSVSMFFQQSQMLRREEAIQSLTRKIVKQLGYEINPDVKVIQSDGMDPIYNYVYKPFLEDMESDEEE